MTTSTMTTSTTLSPVNKRSETLLIFFSRIFGSKKIFFSIDVGLFFKTLNKVGLNLEQQRENSEIEKKHRLKISPSNDDDMLGDA